MTVQTSVVPCAEGHRLHLSGPLPQLWMGNLTAALAMHRCSIISAQASLRGEEWLADFVLNCSAAPVDPASIDFIALAHAGGGILEPRVQLDRCTIQPLADGKLLLEVTGPDQSGFLSKLLRILLDAQMRPIGVDINTREGMIDDRLELTGIDGPLPDSAMETLRALLAPCVAPS